MLPLEQALPTEKVEVRISKVSANRSHALRSISEVQLVGKLARFPFTIMVNGSGQRVLVSFSAPQPILSSVKWQQVQAAISDQLPLRNIHWKPVSRRSIRTIQELDVGLVSLEAVRDEYSQIPITL